VVALVKNKDIGRDKGFFNSTSAISATFIGTVIGAGFASGQEIYQFFSVYGTFGFIGIIFAVLLMGWAGAKIFRVGYRLKTESYHEFLIYILGRRLAPIVDLLLFLFFVVLIGVMFAGSGALFESLGMNYWSGEILTAILLIAVLFFDLAGLISANLIVIPLMLVGSLGISFFGVFTQCATPVTSSFHLKWILATLQFSAYNIVLAIPVLIALTKEYPYLRYLKYGGWLGSIGLGIMAWFIQWALLSHLPQLGKSDLPMIELARSAGKIPYLGYAIILWGEMFTTLLANTYGLARRLVALSELSYRIWVILITFAGLVIAQIGFINLIAYCYPLFGGLCLVILVLLLRKPVK
jgi:uncharacterized membrane protein YkvI